MHRRTSPGAPQSRPPPPPPESRPSRGGVSKPWVTHAVTAGVTALLCVAAFALLGGGGARPEPPVRAPAATTRSAFPRHVPPHSGRAPEQQPDARLASLAQDEDPNPPERRTPEAVRTTPAPPTLVPPEKIAEMIARSQRQGDGPAEGDAPESTDAPELHDPSEVHKPSRIPNRRWQYSNVPAPLPPRDAAMHRRWKEAEPGLEHVVLRDAECDRALGQYFPKVPRGAGSMSFALRAAVCGLVAVWHDGGYYVHRDVAPGKPLSQWLLNHTGPSELVLIQSSAGPEALVGFFFGAAKQQRCVAAAIDAVAGLPTERLFSSRFAADAHDERRHDVPREVMAPLLGEDCEKVRFELQWSGQMELPETPHAHSPLELHLWNDTDTGPGVGDDLPLPWRRWVVEESGHANAARVDGATCATAFEAVRGEAPAEAVSKGMASTEPELRRTLCAAIQMRHTGGIAVTRPLRWVRPTALWLPEEPQLVLVADANATDAVMPGFVAGRGPNPCLDALAQKVADAWSAGDGVTQTVVHGVVADCGTLLPATIAQGDGFVV